MYYNSVGSKYAISLMFAYGMLTYLLYGLVFLDHQYKGDSLLDSDSMS